MGQAKQRGSFEQRKAMAEERDALLMDMFCERDVNGEIVHNALRLIPMTPDKLATLRERSKRMYPA